jgi:hypothetical protein
METTISLYDEVIRRFPELPADLERHRNLPYFIMGELVHWLTTLPGEARTDDVTQRVKAIARWLEEQPGNDYFELCAIGLYENLFDSEEGRKWLPLLLTRKEMEDDSEFWQGLVGEVRYAKGLEAYCKCI